MNRTDDDLDGDELENWLDMLRRIAGTEHLHGANNCEMTPEEEALFLQDAIMREVQMGDRVVAISNDNSASRGADMFSFPAGIPRGDK